MPVYLLKKNLTIKNELYKKQTISPLKVLEAEKIQTLLDMGLIKELTTPPLSVFAPLKSYAKMLESKGISNLGDFAYADLSSLNSKNKADILALQVRVKEILKPDSPLVDCGCGESPRANPLHTD